MKKSLLIISSVSLVLCSDTQKIDILSKEATTKELIKKIEFAKISVDMNLTRLQILVSQMFINPLADYSEVVNDNVTHAQSQMTEITHCLTTLRKNLDVASSDSDSDSESDT